MSKPIPKKDLEVINTSWQDRVSNLPKYTGWHYTETREGSQQTAHLWMSERFSLYNIKVLDRLIPFTPGTHTDQIDLEEQVNFTPYIYIKLDLLNVNDARSPIGYKEIVVNSPIKRISPIADFEVFQNMAACEQNKVKYKVGDTVAVKNADDAMLYRITEVNGSEVTLYSYMFDRPIYKTAKIEEIHLHTQNSEGV